MPQKTEITNRAHHLLDGFSIGQRLTNAPSVGHDQLLLQAIEESNQLPIPNDLLISITLPDEKTSDLSYQAWATPLVDHLRLVSGRLDPDRTVRELHVYLCESKPAVTLVEHLLNRIRAHFTIATDALLVLHLPIGMRVGDVLTQGIKFPRIQARFYLDLSCPWSDASVIDAARDPAIDTIALALKAQSPLSQSSDMMASVLEQTQHPKLSWISFENLDPQQGPHQNLLNTFADIDPIIKNLRQDQFHLIGGGTFVRPTDPYAQAHQHGDLGLGVAGYITQAALDTIGLGLNAITMMGQHIAINQGIAKSYLSALQKQRLPIAHGQTLGQDDLIRQTILSDLACKHELSIETLQRRFRICFKRHFEMAYPKLQQMSLLGLIEWKGGRISVTPSGLAHLSGLLSLFSLPIGSITDEPHSLSRIG